MARKFGGGYFENHWGKKWSIISLIFILIVLGVMYGRYRYLVATDQYEPTQDTIELYGN